MNVTLLGTDSPPPVMNRFGPSTLVEAADHKLVFDAGRGAMQRLDQIRVQWDDVSGMAGDTVRRILGNHTATADDLIPPTRKTYSGPLEVGEDLMVIHVGSAITVVRPGSAVG